MMDLNKVYEGDCYQLIKNIPDSSIDLIYTDIPYLYHKGGCSTGQFAERKKKNNRELEDISDGIDYSIFDEMVRVMKSINIYIWCSQMQLIDIMDYFVKDHECRMNVLVWCKTNPMPIVNNTWLNDVEYCLCFKGKGAPRYNDGYDIKSKWYVSAINKADKDLYHHPTIKPLDLVKRHILHSSSEGDIVLDPFCGSGTTLKACKDLGRQYIGIEIDPEYCKVAQDRLNNLNANGEYSLF